MAFPGGSPSASILSALDKIPTVSSSSGSSIKLDPIKQKEIEAFGSGLGKISLSMFEPAKWYSPIPYSFHVPQSVLISLYSQVATVGGGHMLTLHEQVSGNTNPRHPVH